MLGVESYDKISKDVCRALESIVGEKYISTDPVVREAYTGRGMDRDIFWFQGVCRTPAAVVIPQNTDQVSEILKTCYSYNVPYTPMTTFGLAVTSPSFRDDIILIDLKRINNMTIDDENMQVILEPGVSFAQMHGETLKRGLIGCMPGGGGGTSVLVNQFVNGMGLFNYRITYASQRRLNGVEWVSPEGKVYRLGSLASGGDNWFWQDAPGPNIYGLLHGISSWQGGMGIVTRISTKLYPFQPKKLEPGGISYDSHVVMPEDRVRWYNIAFKREEDIEKACSEIGHARIGLIVNRVPAYWRDIGKARGDEASSNRFWDLWNQRKEEELKQRRVLRICLVGRASAEQLAYEERVLMDIIKENGGIAIPTRQIDEASFFAVNSPGMWMATGFFAEGEGGMESLKCTTVARRRYARELANYLHKGDFLDQKEETPWYMGFNLGRLYYIELHCWPDTSEMDPSDTRYVPELPSRFLAWRWGKCQKITNDTGMQSFFPGMVQPVHPLSNTFQRYHTWVNRFKLEFDPKELSAPGQPYIIDKMIDSLFPDSIGSDLRDDVKVAEAGPWMGNPT